VRSAYVYYRIDPALAAAAASAIETLLAMLAPHCATPPRHLTRCDDPDLWLEVYEGIADFASFTRRLAEAVHLLGYHRFIEGERHLESFCVPPQPSSRP
jgi:hypothetical protein